MAQWNVNDLQNLRHMFHWCRVLESDVSGFMGYFLIPQFSSQLVISWDIPALFTSMKQQLLNTISQLLFAVVLDLPVCLL